MTCVVIRALSRYKDSVIEPPEPLRLHVYSPLLLYWAESESRLVHILQCIEENRLAFLSSVVS